MELSMLACGLLNISHLCMTIRSAFNIWTGHTSVYVTVQGQLEEVYVLFLRVEQ